MISIGVFAVPSALAVYGPISLVAFVLVTVSALALALTTVQVLHGRVRLVAGDTSWEGLAGDLIVVPDARHSLDAIEDSAVLLTCTARSVRITRPPELNR